MTGGQITLDGKDIRRISMEELREEIGFVPQKGVLSQEQSLLTCDLEKQMRQMRI